MTDEEKEKLLTAAFNKEENKVKLAEACAGRFKRLIQGYTCNKCGSTEVYSIGAVMWGPYGGHRLCGGCGAIGELYEPITRGFCKVINVDTGEEVIQQKTSPTFTINLKDPNCGKTLRRWAMLNGGWVEQEVPETEMPE